MKRYLLAVLVGLALLSVSGRAATLPPDSQDARKEAAELAKLPPVAPPGHIDHSGRKQKGRASFYAHHFTNRKMADGNRFNPNSNVAASKTLPLGTTVKVTSLANGRSAVAKVEDRGAFSNGRVLDLAPRVAEQIGIGKRGVVPVVVAPIAVPQPNGAIKLGAGAAEASPHEVEAAVQETATSVQ